MDFPIKKTIYVENIAKVVNSILFIFPGKSDTNFANPLLHALELREFMENMKYLCNNVVLVKANQRSEELRYGNVCVYDVNVRRGRNKDLEFFDKGISERLNFMKEKNLPKAILIHSTSLYVVDAKLAVFRRLKNDLLLGDTFLHHVFDEYEELSKLCAHQTMSFFIKKVIAMAESIPIKRIPDILKEAAIKSLSEKNIRQLCHNVVLRDEGTRVGNVFSASYPCRLLSTVNRLKQKLIKDTLEEIVKHLASEISKDISVHIEANILQELEKNFGQITISFAPEIFEEVNVVIVRIIYEVFYELKRIIVTVVAYLWTMLIPIDINSRSWRNKVVEEMYQKIKEEEERILKKTLQKIIYFCEETVSELENVCRILEERKNDLGLILQEKVVKEWERREIIKDPSELKMYPSILTFIAGRKNDAPCVKVFLKFDDLGAKLFFKSRVPYDTKVEFVNVTKHSSSVKEEQKQVEVKETEKNILQKEENTLVQVKETEKNIHEKDFLYKKLEEEEDNIYFKYSNIVAIETCLETFHAEQTRYCLTFYCLDKYIIPFGEKPLPNELWGFPCFIREDIVQLGFCDNCQEVKPGCSIGLPEITITGSVGFLARSNNASASPITGFLTAAHVAVKEFEELLEMEEKFSHTSISTNLHDIVHPSKPDSANSTVIGNVVESFCGNYDKSIGIDAAFVRVYQPRRREQVKLRTYSEDPPLMIEVVKDGRATGRTKGILKSKKYSCKVDKIGNKHITPKFFKNCYSIIDNTEVFFREGDSGSGVYVNEHNQQIPLGIAFAFHSIGRRTAVCKINTVLEVLDVSIVQEKDMVVEEDMDTS